MTGETGLDAGDRVSLLGRNLTFGLLDAIGRDIVTGKYADTVFPTEAELASRYGVSRSVTREAVKMLGAKGLLSARPRQGTVVREASSWNLLDEDVLGWMLARQVSPELVRQFNELRAAVEPEAAALASRNAQPEDLEGISKGLERMRAAERGEDDHLDADIAFHLAILEASKNPFYSQLRMMVSAALRASIKLSNRIMGRTADVDAHAKVYEAIVAGDADEARNAMRQLITEVLRLINGVD